MRTSFFKGHDIRPSVRLRLEIDRVVARFRFGIHRSVMSGFGMEFRGFKPYESSDPPNAIDYLASERLSQEPEFEPVVRQYHPEKEIGVVFLLSAEESMSLPAQKISHALELLWLFALSAFKHRDRFRIILFGECPLYDSGWLLREDQIENFFGVLAREGDRAVGQSKNVDIFSHLSSLPLFDAMAVVVSDFTLSWEKELLALRRLEIIEKNIKVMMLALEEWGGFLPLSFGLSLRDPRDKIVRHYSKSDVAELAAQARQHFERIRQGVRALAVPFIEVPLLQSPVRTVERAFLRMSC